MDHVVQGMDAGTRDLFMQVDPDVVSLVAAKTVFVYTLGALRNAPVPIFLKRATRDQIVALRAQFGAAAPSNALRTLFNSQVAYAAGLVAGHADRPKFQAIVAASGSELQGSEFLTQGWAGAIALMP